MASPNDPADVFLGYSRRDGRSSPGLFSTVLEHASFMTMNTCFYDNRLEAGEDWGEELEKHASGCKVFVAMVGKGWLEILRQRREDEQGIDTTTSEQEGSVTDWVYKELELALERDDPAKVLVVRMYGAAFEPGDAHELFPLGKVRDYFTGPNIQMLEYRGPDDNQAFSSAVEKMLYAYHSNAAIVPEPGSRVSLFDSMNPWLRFLSRENVWEQLRSQMGVGMPKEPIFDAEPDLQKSVALLAPYDSRKDEPRELIRGVSHHLYVEGRYSQAAASGGESSSTDEHWSTLNSFGWPANASDERVLFRAILETLNVDSAQRDIASENAQQFVAKVAEVYCDKHKGLSPCLYTSISEKEGKKLELASAFAQRWNRLDWSALPHRVVLVIGIRASVDAAEFSQKLSDTQLVSEPVGVISAACVDTWIEEFLQNRLAVDELQPPPSWYAKVKHFSLEDDRVVRYADVEATLIRHLG